MVATTVPPKELLAGEWVVAEDGRMFEFDGDRLEPMGAVMTRTDPKVERWRSWSLVAMWLTLFTLAMEVGLLLGSSLIARIPMSKLWELGLFRDSLVQAAIIVVLGWTIFLALHQRYRRLGGRF